MTTMPLFEYGSMISFKLMGIFGLRFRQTSLKNHQENLSVICIPPLHPLLYSKTGVYRGKPILILLQNIDCGYSLELPCRGGSNVCPQSMF